MAIAMATGVLGKQPNKTIAFAAGRPKTIAECLNERNIHYFKYNVILNWYWIA
jgi:hypothetical protein